MGDGEVNTSPQSFTEYFEAVFPAYLAMGMTYEQFWEGDPSLVRAYRTADRINRRRRNEEMWLNGLYMMEALSSTVGNMFAKGATHQYPHEPFPITLEEQEERKERERRAKMERIKAAFTARALSMNAKFGGKTDG